MKDLMRMKYLPYVMNLTFSFIMLGLLEFVNAEFNIKNITSSQYVFNVLIPSIINLSIMFSAIYLYKALILESNKNVEGKETEINNIVNNDLDTDFDKFLFEKNTERKIQAYIKKINKRIMKLEKKASFDDKLLYMSDEEEKKKRNKYCVERKQLEDVINTRHKLEKEIHYIDVKYKPLKKSQVVNNYDTKNSEDKAFENFNNRALLDNLPTWFFIASLTAFFYSFTLITQKFLLITVIYYLVRLMFATYSFFNGKRYMEDKGLKMILHNLDTRIDIFKQYFKWKIGGKHEANND